MVLVAYQGEGKTTRNSTTNDSDKENIMVYPIDPI